MMTRLKILFAASALALSSAAIAGDDPGDELILKQESDKIAAAKADPAVAKFGGTELAKAEAALKDLDNNLDEDDDIDTKAIVNRIDALVETAQLRAKIANAKQASDAAETARTEATEARAEIAEAEADAAKATVDALRDELSEYKMKQTEAGATLIVEDVIFETAKADLKAGAVARLQPLVAFLTAHPEVEVRVAGHTDARGSETYNQRLSEARATSVRNALVTAGIDAARLQTVGYGETMPVADNNTAAGMQANRRVEITLLGQQLAMSN